MNQPNKGIHSTVLQLPSELPDLVYVVGRNWRHVEVQMRNYGYAQEKCNGPVRKYVMVTDVDILRGLSGIHLWVLDGTQYCECRRYAYENIMAYVLALPHRFKVSLAPEIDSEMNIVKRSIYDLRNS